MKKENFEIVVKYSRWEIEIIDTNDCSKILELKKISKSWFSTNNSGSFFIGNTKYELLTKNNGAHLLENGYKKVGQVTFSDQRTSGYSRSANIEIEGMNLVFTRENLKQIFALATEDDNTVLTITGKLYPERQKNLFKFFYIDDKLYHSVILNEHITRINLLLILVICGYSIRFFLEMDSD